MSSPAVYIPSVRRRRILALALPIIGGMLSQNVLNLVDTAMVGTLGDAALGAVGLGGFMNFLLSAAVLGLATGVQAMASRRVGQGAEDRTAVPLNGGLLVAVLIAVPWSALLIALAPTFYPHVNSDPDVIAQGVPYLQVRLVAMVALAMNHCFRGYWNAVGRSMLYLRTILLMHVVNIVLNWVFIFGHLGAPALGATGAGVASAISMFVGTVSYFLLGLSHARTGGFLRGVPDKPTILTMFRVSVPTSIQQSFYAGGLTAFMWIVGQVGTQELGAANVLTHLSLVGLLPGLGFGLASASFVGHALGRRDPDDARRWAWQVVRLAIVGVLVVALPAVIAPRFVLSGFIHSHDTLELAVVPLRLVGTFIAFDAAGLVLMQSLMGAGATRRTMVVSIISQWCVFLPAAYVVGPQLGLGLTALWVAYAAYRLGLAGTFACMWRGTSWTRIAV